MDFDEYQRMALTTAIYPDRGSNIAYPALGLAGESGEICEKIGRGPKTDEERDALARELGDILWYVAVGADELGVKLSQIAWGSGSRWRNLSIDAFQTLTRQTIPDDEDGIRRGLASVALDLAGASGNVCDRVKKMFRDDGGTLTDARRMAIVAGLSQMLQHVSLMATELGGSLEQTAEMNVEKLASRKRRGTIMGDGDNR